MDAEALSAIARRHGIVLIVRFGSTVTGRTHPDSDTDLGILFERLPDPNAELEAVAALQAIYRHRDVDITLLNRADPLLLKQVTDAAVLEYGSPARLEALRRYAFKRYHDHRPFFEMEREYVARSTACGSPGEHSR